MMYMFKVNMLIAAIVFGWAGLFILGLFAWTEAKKQVSALRLMHATSPARRARFAISRLGSRNRDNQSVQAI
jgi:hypothetical protein